MAEIIRLNAGNDRNGNPRRVFVEISKGSVIGTWDEGYNGSHAIPARKRNKWSGLSIETTVTEYRDLISMIF